MSAVEISVVLPIGAHTEVSIRRGASVVRSGIVVALPGRAASGGSFVASVIDSHAASAVVCAWKRACGGCCPLRHFSISSLP